MLKLKGYAEIQSIVPLVEYHGDDLVKAIAVRMTIKAVPLEHVEAGFVSQLNLFYGIDELLRIADIEPELRVTRTIENVTAEIGNVGMVGMRVRKARVKLNARKLCDITLSLVGETSGVLDALHDLLRHTVPIELIEEAAPVAQEEAA